MPEKFKRSLGDSSSKPPIEENRTKRHSQVVKMIIIQVQIY
jgi:hypothetical protein